MIDRFVVPMSTLYKAGFEVQPNDKTLKAIVHFDLTLDEVEIRLVPNALMKFYTLITLPWSLAGCGFSLKLLTEEVIDPVFFPEQSGRFSVIILPQNNKITNNLRAALYGAK